MRGLLSPISTCVFGNVPLPLDEEFMGRNSPTDAGTSASNGNEASPDDYFGSGDVLAEMLRY